MKKEFVNKKLNNPIEEYFDSDQSKISKYSELFKGNDEFIDQMTELSDRDIKLALVLYMNDEYLLNRHKMDSPIYAGYLQKFMRLMVSKDRKSRGEYVDVHKAELEQERRGAQPMLTGGRLQ